MDGRVVTVIRGDVDIRATLEHWISVVYHSVVISQRKTTITRCFHPGALEHLCQSLVMTVLHWDIQLSVVLVRGFLVDLCDTSY
jgi:hypothetical protein